MKIPFFIIILLISNLMMAQNLKPTTASISFKIKMLGVAVNGSFKGLASTALVFDGTNLTTANINVTVDAKTVDTDNNLRNSHLREKEEFFDVNKYPIIRAKSTKFEKSSDGGYIGYFDLTIKNITKNVKIPFEFTKNGTTAQFKGSVTINRRDWKVGGGTLGMANDVTLSLLLNAQQP
jgi:polyisoprenoid-binding protein YceI